MKVHSLHPSSSCFAVVHHMIRSHPPCHNGGEILIPHFVICLCVAASVVGSLWICFISCLHHNRLLPLFVISFFTLFVIIVAYCLLRHSLFSVSFIHCLHVLLLFLTWFVVIVPPLHSSKSFVDVFCHIVCYIICCRCL